MHFQKFNLNRFYVLFALMLALLAGRGDGVSAQSSAPYIQYYARALDAFVIERADGSDSRVFAPDVMPAEHQAVQIVGWSASGEWFAWLSAPEYLTGGIITRYGVWLVDSSGVPVHFLDDIDDLTGAYWSASGDVLYLLNSTYDDAQPAAYTADVAAQTVTEAGAPAEQPPASPVYPDFDEPFVSPDGRVQIDSSSGELTYTDSEAAIPVQRFSGYTGEMVCNVLWHPGGEWFVREDGIIIAGGGCPSGLVVADVAGTMQRELTVCPLGGLCAAWVPEQAASHLAPGQSTSVIPAPAALLRHGGTTLAVGWNADGMALAAFEDSYATLEQSRTLLIWTDDGGRWTLAHEIAVDADCYAWVYPSCAAAWRADGTQVAIAGPFDTHIVTPDTGEDVLAEGIFAGWLDSGEPVLTAASATALSDSDYDPEHGWIARIDSPDGMSAVNIVVVDAATGTTVYTHTFEGDSMPTSLSILPDGSGVAVAAFTPSIWRFADDSLLPLQVAGSDYVTGVKAAGQYVFAYGLSALIHVYDAATGELVTRLNRSAYDVALSPDGAWLATAGGDGVSLWDVSATLAP